MTSGMKQILISYVSVLTSYLVLDAIWLGFIAKESYLQAMQGMLRDDYPMAPWIAFYLMYSGAIVYLVVLPNKLATSQKVLMSGAVLGMASYGAYNLTNYAILEGWPLMISLKDWVWGMVISSVTSYVGWLSLYRFRDNSLSK